MNMAKRYLITTPTPAVTTGRKAREFIMLPNNSIVDVSLPLDGIRGLIEVTVDGETMLMFAEDLRLRGRLVFHASA